MNLIPAADDRQILLFCFSPTFHMSSRNFIMSILSSRLRQIAVVAATALYAFTPTSGSMIAATAAGTAAVSILSVSQADAAGKIRGRTGQISLKDQVKKEGVVRAPAKRCARTIDGGCR